MLNLRLILILLFVAALSVATYLQPRLSARAQAEGQSGSLLVLLLGDGRKMFANQLYAKADDYFHRGEYPSIFDHQARNEEDHMTSAATHEGHDHASGNHDHAEGEHDAHEDAASPQSDWLADFGRHFYPTEHVHLESQDAREMLPWLRLSVEMDPHQVQVYAVTAYFLRDRMGRVDETEEFLREGLRNNPRNAEILYQLGCCFRKRDDPARANNLWVAALASWREFEQPKKDPDLLLLRNILDGLILVAEKKGSIQQALEYLQQLKVVSPSPERIQGKIDELKRQHSLQSIP
jgi:tetratricopeptide (TPR) repeat protein